MSFLSKAFKPYRKVVRKIRKKVGISSKNKFWRQSKRHLKELLNPSPSPLSSSQATSASTVYQHQPKTLSQLVGGV